MLLADNNSDALAKAAESLSAEGHHVQSRQVEVSSQESVHALAEHAASLGSVTQVAHTAGLSPSQAPAEAILAVDLVGVALVLEEFGEAVAWSTAAALLGLYRSCRRPRGSRGHRMS